MKTASAINYLKNMQATLRGMILDIDKLQVALTELPPQQLGPSVPKINGAHHVTVERRRRDHPGPMRGALIQGVTDAIDDQVDTPFTVDTLVVWLKAHRGHLVSKNPRMAHSNVSATVCRLVKRGEVEPVGRDGKRRTYRRIPGSGFTPAERYAAFRQGLEVGKTVET